MEFARSYLGLKATTQLPKEGSTVRALPASWYRSDSLYQLERRAIFSKRWLLVTHKLRFINVGDWVRFEEAGFQFFLVRGRDGHIRGFHNICRHRAFPIVLEDRGQAKILACKYHGWSYGLTGKLAKAPGYQDMEGFDSSQNGLLQIHVHVDNKGFVWVNLDAAEVPEVGWADDFLGVDTQQRFEQHDFESFQFDHAWQMGGDYNWKTLADNYNECYHCPTTHPDVASLVDTKIYSVGTKGGHIQHFPFAQEQAKDQHKIASTFYFPNACMTVSPHFFYMMRCVPTAANHCSMEYEVYRHRDADPEEFKQVDAMFKRILSEDKWLCSNAQKNLNAGVFVSGELHPRMEKGPLFFQDKVRGLLQGHRQLEEASKQEIWPARQKGFKASASSADDEEFCSQLDCATGASKIEW